MEPELTDQRDYTLVVQNERGHQSAVVRLRVTLPLSPVLMITSAFVTICGLFFLSLVVMFLLKKRHESSQNGSNGLSRNDRSSSKLGNTNKASVEHLKNGNIQATGGVETSAGANTVNGNATNGQLMQQTRGIVNGAGNGLANNASNPIGGHQSSLSVISGDDVSKIGAHVNNAALMSMASSDTSGDQKQLLSDRNSSASGSSTTTTTNHHFNVANSSSSANSTNSTGQSTANSTPVPLNHISVEQVDDLSNHGLGLGSHLQSSPQGSALIYANLDYTDHHHHLNQQHQQSIEHEQQQQQCSISNTSGSTQQTPVLRRQQTPVRQSPSGSSMADSTIQQQQQQQQLFASHQLQHQQQGSPQGGAIRSSVGATIAMMNSLAAAANQAPVNNNSSSSGVLNGAINQQLANSRQIRKPGPPKPPKPSIQQRSRFYQQHAVNSGGLVMIGQQQQHQHQPQTIDNHQGDHDQPPTANELAVEYSRIAFPARAEL